MVAAAEPDTPATEGWEEICDLSGEDDEIRQVISLLQAGFVDQEKWSSVLPWFALRGGLGVVDTALMYKGRMVVPAAGRSATLANLQHAHHGQINIVVRAQYYVW